MKIPVNGRIDRPGGDYGVPRFEDRASSPRWRDRDNGPIDDGDDRNDGAFPQVDPTSDGAPQSYLPESYVEQRAGPLSPRELGRLNLIGYARSSTDLQDTSIEYQTDEIKAYCERVKGNLLRIAFDEARTGTTLDERPGLQEALDCLRSEEADGIVVFRASRLSRVAGDLLSVWSLIEQTETELHTTDRGRIGGAEVLFEAVFSQAELARIKGQFKAGVAHMISKGLIPHAPAFGYDLHQRRPGYQFPHATRAKHVLWAFEQRAAGVGPITIARRFSELRLPTPREASKVDNGKITPSDCKCEWDASMVNAMFRNPTYMGVITYGKEKKYKDPRTKKIVIRKRPRKEWKEAFNPRMTIVPPMLWLYVYQLCVTTVSAMPGVGFGLRDSTFMFSGRMHCGHLREGVRCDGTLTLRSHNHGSPKVKCGTAQRTPARCAAGDLHEVATIERLVLGLIGRHVLDEDLLAIFRAGYERGIARSQADHDAKVRRLRTEAAEAQASLDASFDAGLMAGFDAEQAAHQRQRILKKLNKAKADLREVPAVVDLAVGLDRLDTLAKGLAMMAEASPYRPVDAEGRRLVATARDLVTDILIEPALEDGTVWIEVRTDIGAVVGSPMPAEAFFAPGRFSNRVSYNLHAARAADEAARRVEREARKEDEANAGRHDLSEEAWALVAGYFDDLDFGPDSSPRLVLNGMMFVMKTGGRISQIPKRFGEAKAFKLKVAKLVRRLGWDRARDALRREMPEALQGADVTRFDSSAFPRSFQLMEAPFRDTPAAEILRLSAAETDPVVAKRLRAVALFKQGAMSADEVGREVGTVANALRGWTHRFDVGGVEELRKARYTRRAGLSKEQVTGLKDFLMLGVNPYELDKVLGIEAVRRHVEDLHDVHLSNGRLGNLLREAGLGIFQTAVVKAKKRARQAAQGAPSAIRRMPSSRGTAIDQVDVTWELPEEPEDADVAGPGAVPSEHRFIPGLAPPPGGMSADPGGRQ